MQDETLRYFSNMDGSSDIWDEAIARASIQTVGMIFQYMGRSISQTQKALGASITTWLLKRRHPNRHLLAELGCATGKTYVAAAVVLSVAKLSAK